ncbi:hypothetical protein MMC07_005576 [Pseudocyphellaria aurata]|nr:hypothetical protein [Pseudocyphellaria aurata]
MADPSSTRPPSPPLSRNEMLGRELLKRKSVYGNFLNNRDDFWNNHVEPGRPITHWDMVLAELKWMQKDFTMERRLKMYQAYVLAHLCRNWWIYRQAPPQPTRRVLQLRADP